jgi:hypothetical protein
MALINTTTTGVLGTTVFGDGSGDLTIQQNGVLVNKITSNGLTYRGTGSVLQVVNTHYTTPTSQSLTANIDNNITGLEASITPASTSSKILIFVRWFGENGTDGQMWETMYGISRDGTAIGLPTATGAHTRGIHMAALSYGSANQDSTPETAFYNYLDSPSTTSAVTYRAYVRGTANQTLYTNRVVANTDATSYERGTSSIILMEFAG